MLNCKNEDLLLRLFKGCIGNKIQLILHHHPLSFVIIVAVVVTKVFRHHDHDHHHHSHYLHYFPCSQDSIRHETIQLIYVYSSSDFLLPNAKYVVTVLYISFLFRRNVFIITLIDSQYFFLFSLYVKRLTHLSILSFHCQH